MSVFLRLHQKVTPTMSRRCLIWKVVNFPMSLLVTGQVSAPYNRTNITRVRNAHILVALKRFWLRKTFLLHIWYSVPAFSILLITSFPTFPDCSTVVPIYEKLFTSSNTRPSYYVFDMLPGGIQLWVLWFLHIDGHPPTTACYIQYF